MNACVSVCLCAHLVSRNLAGQWGQLMQRRALFAGEALRLVLIIKCVCLEGVWGFAESGTNHVDGKVWLLLDQTGHVLVVGMETNKQQPAFYLFSP